MKKETNVFKIFGIYGKELCISNFLAWLFNFEKGPFNRNFLNDFLKSVGCQQIEENNMYNIIREWTGKKTIKVKKNKNKIVKKNDFIDIVIEEKDSNNKIIHVVAIENKVFSSEGNEQTERYWNKLQDEYSKDKPVIDGIYFTKSNLPVVLSNSKFKHYRYSDLKDLFVKYSKEKLVYDFLESYILTDEIKLKELEALTIEEYKGENIHKDLCYYTTEKIISKDNDKKNEIFCELKSKYHEKGYFYKIRKKTWEKTIERQSFNIHLEGTFKTNKKGILNNSLYLHFETLPYIAFKKLGTRNKKIVINIKSEFEKLLDNLGNIENVTQKSKTGVLSLGNFVIQFNSFKEYYKIVNNLIEKLDPIIMKLFQTV